MKILLLGHGGREHAICWKLSQSPLVSSIHTLPGNPGTALVAKNKNVSMPLSDLAGILAYAKKENFDLTVVGPEAPLVDGIVDLFAQHHLTIFGPTKNAAQMEGSKVFSKSIMEEAGVPTAKSWTFSDQRRLLEHLDACDYPVVLKADGLAGGKGVAICQDRDEAVRFASDCMEKNRFSAAGKTVLVEEFLIGYEVSFLVFACGTRFISMDTAQDHKKLLNNDLGPNTGGMGAVSPAQNLSLQQKKEIEGKVIAPILELLDKKGMPFSGILYAGLMMTEQGVKVLEFNVRFGDPETQVLLPRLKNDLAEIFYSIAKHRKLPDNLHWDPRFAVGLVLASEGYPENAIKGQEISIDPITDETTFLFHAGTEMKSGKLVSNGGRVFTLTSLDEHLVTARNKVYNFAEKIKFSGKIYRTDIGHNLLRL